MNTFPLINYKNRPKESLIHPTPILIYNKPSIDESNFNSSVCTQNFSDLINIEGDSIYLALKTLGMSKEEYNSMTIQELKYHKRINSSLISAFNILIYYKQNSKSFLPQLNLSSIHYKNNWINSNEPKITSAKIHPE